MTDFTSPEFIIAQNAANDAAVPPGKEAQASGPDAAPPSPSALDDEFNGNTLDAKWTWVNQSNASATLTGTGQLKFKPATGSMVWSMLLQAVPSGDWTFGAKFRMQGNIGDFCSCGIAVRNSSTAAHANIGLYTKAADPGNGGIEFQEYSDLTTYAADISIFRRGLIDTDVYIKLQKSGTNLISFYSMDGITYTQVATEAIATVLGAVNQIGLSVWSMSGGSATPFEMIVEWFRKLA